MLEKGKKRRSRKKKIRMRLKDKKKNRKNRKKLSRKSKRSEKENGKKDKSIRIEQEKLLGTIQPKMKCRKEMRKVTEVVV